MKQFETPMKRHANNFGEKESMIVIMDTCNHWSKRKHKMFVRREKMVKKIIKSIKILHDRIHIFF